MNCTYITVSTTSFWNTQSISNLFLADLRSQELCTAIKDTISQKIFLLPSIPQQNFKWRAFVHLYWLHWLCYVYIKFRVKSHERKCLDVVWQRSLENPRETAAYEEKNRTEFTERLKLFSATWLVNLRECHFLTTSMTRGHCGICAHACFDSSITKPCDSSLGLNMKCFTSYPSAMIVCAGGLWWMSL